MLKSRLKLHLEDFRISLPYPIKIQSIVPVSFVKRRLGIILIPLKYVSQTLSIYRISLISTTALARGHPFGPRARLLFSLSRTLSQPSRTEHHWPIRSISTLAYPDRSPTHVSCN